LRHTSCRIARFNLPIHPIRAVSGVRTRAAEERERLIPLEIILQPLSNSLNLLLMSRKSGTSRLAGGRKHCGQLGVLQIATDGHDVNLANNA